jgi:phospholipase/carboxylesterase
MDRQRALAGPIGFSQGAIMALESTQQPSHAHSATRVIAIAGRFAQLPRHAPQGVAVHLMHGEQDRVIEAIGRRMGPL